MACRTRLWVSRGRRAGAWVAMVVMLCLSSAAGECLNHISVARGLVVRGAGDSFSVMVAVKETEVVGHLLYSVTWDEDVSPSIPSQGDFANYFHVDNSSAREWRVSLKESLVGLPDSPLLKCSVVLSHHLQDDNTQTPVVEASSWFLHIPKDFPIATPLQGLTVTVTDKDATTPNNLVEVDVEGVCPLVAGKRQYGGVAGEHHLVHFYLTSPLEELVNQTLACTIKVTDMGSPPLFSRSLLTVYVVEDLPSTTTTATTTTSNTLEMELPFYLAEVWPGMEVGSFLNMFPAPVKVKGDLMLSQVTYTIRNAWLGVNGAEVFAINSLTGQVFLARKLDDSWAAGCDNTSSFVPLVIQAKDQSSRVTTAVLQVTMKTQGTTSTGTLPSTTPAPSRHHDSSTACPCLASWSRGQRRLSFTRLSYAAEVFSTDTFVGRVEARLGTRGGSVRYSWASPANVTSFIINSISGVITIGPLRSATGSPPASCQCCSWPPPRHGQGQRASAEGGRG
ncbi:uncharacterized protein LOC123514993 isoform X2 [Portunus trituberculatus]|uniref:uncharacterized protein LOC123514993 isoform X2 n=1 Tax=Portunus trituberculatus TaxID=210409 RepID=UPI001E1D19F2|nr:uncharacterized protein LOC123514993 isoform X2 [Portunus trituberculatus]